MINPGEMRHCVCLLELSGEVDCLGGFDEKVWKQQGKSFKGLYTSGSRAQMSVREQGDRPQSRTEGELVLWAAALQGRVLGGDWRLKINGVLFCVIAIDYLWDVTGRMIKIEVRQDSVRGEI